jgi:hypothetical protein
MTLTCDSGPLARPYFVPANFSRQHEVSERGIETMPYALLMPRRSGGPLLVVSEFHGNDVREMIAIAVRVNSTSISETREVGQDLPPGW